MALYTMEGLAHQNAAGVLASFEGPLIHGLVQGALEAFHHLRPPLKRPWYL